MGFEALSEVPKRLSNKVEIHDKLLHTVAAARYRSPKAMQAQLTKSRFCLDA